VYAYLFILRAAPGFTSGVRGWVGVCGRSLWSNVYFTNCKPKLWFDKWKLCNNLYFNLTRMLNHLHYAYNDYSDDMKNWPFIWLAANIPLALNACQRDPKGQKRMDNPETRTTLEARHRTKTIIQRGQHRMPKWWPKWSPTHTHPPPNTGA
jgi:hypothetical protein